MSKISAVRIVLNFGSLVFGLSALALVVTPSLFNELLGLTPNISLDWSMRMTGITWFTALYAAVGFSFSAAYAVTLLRK